MSHTIEKSVVVDATPDRAWKVAADQFDQVGQWASGVAISKPNTKAPTPQGAAVGGRVCSAPGFGDIEETFTRFDADNRRFTYAAHGLPGFVTKMENTWTVTPVGNDKSKLSMRVELDTNAFPGALMAPIMKRKLAGALDGFTKEFKLWVEEGKISDAKRKLNAKQAKKAKR